MKTLSLNVEIKDTDKEDNKLKDEFKFNVEVNFMKTILDFVKEGNDITISHLQFSKKVIEVDEKVEVVNPDTKDKKILNDKIKKDCYNCTGLLEVHKHIILQAFKPRTDIKPRMTKGVKITDVGER